jgi:hypothetical protein
MTADTATPVTIETFHKLPRGSQLLVAYALFNDKYELQLQKSDKDMLGLLNVSWLVAKPGNTHGIVNCNFPDEIWGGFEEIEDKILGSVTEAELTRFVSRKGHEYPWLW